MKVSVDQPAEFEVLKPYPKYRIRLNPLTIVKLESDYEIKPKEKNNLLYCRLEKQDRALHHVVAAHYLGFEEGDKIKFKKKGKKMVLTDFYHPDNLIVTKLNKSGDEDDEKKIKHDDEFIDTRVNYDEIEHSILTIGNNYTINEYIETRDCYKKLKTKEDFQDEIENLREVFAFVQGSPDLFIIKDSYKDLPKLSYSNEAIAKQRLNKIIIGLEFNKDCNKWKELSAYRLYKKYHMLFSYRELAFHSTNPRVFSYFRGYDYQEVANVNMSLIQPFLDHIKVVICNGDENLYKTVLQWYASILRDPCCKLGYALLLISDEGTGKNTFFTDVLCKLMSRYSVPNVNDIDEITGIFNSIMENIKLLICNELLSIENSKKDVSTKLKSPITDNTIRINEKFIPRHTADNVCNFIFVTNELNPFLMKMNNRRFCVLKLSEKYIQNKEYFDKLASTIKAKGFYEHLFTYFMRDVDMTDFNPHQPPMTEEKKEIQNASKNSFELFFEENYDLTMNEITMRDLYVYYCDHVNSLTPRKNQVIVREQTFRRHMMKYLEIVGHTWDQNKNKKDLFKIKSETLEYYQKNYPKCTDESLTKHKKSKISDPRVDEAMDW